ncbi:MAG: DUF4339 domain-containing protein [Opitutaceae bacterium]
MDWYYSDGQKQQGPISETEFNALVEAGLVQPSTMVWHEGLGDWQTHGSLTGVSEPAKVPSLSESISVTRTQDIRREGSVLVMAKGAQLPHRCVKCNKPAEGEPWTKKLSYNHPAIYLLLLINILVLLVVAALTSKKATVDVPVCEFHRAKVKGAIKLSWALCLSAIVLIVCAIGMESGGLGLFGFVTLLVGIFVGIGRGRLVYASKIDQDHVWMKGVCPEYLDELSR